MNLPRHAEVYDVSGAGDTVIGTGADAGRRVHATTVYIANRAAGIVVVNGTAVVTREELAQNLAE